MCLGSIVHLQYYFARSGILEGRSGRQRTHKHKDKDDKGRAKVPGLLIQSDVGNGGRQSSVVGDDSVESPAREKVAEEEEVEGNGGDEVDPYVSDEAMLPPTVSTFRVVKDHVEAPPDIESLRLHLLASLDEVEAVIKGEKYPEDADIPADTQFLMPRSGYNSPYSPSECRSVVDGESEGNPEKIGSPDLYAAVRSEGLRARSVSPSVGGSTEEMRGLKTFNLVTSAIKSARTYFTSHDQPTRLASIKSERQMRRELLDVLDMLKGFATRNFTGGLDEREKADILTWVRSFGNIVVQDRRMELEERMNRARLDWARNDEGVNWTNRELEREHAFLSYLERTNRPLPQWDPVDTAAAASLPTPLLARLRDGRDLVRFHNEAVRISRRRFHRIRSFHEDVARPYRMTDNLRYFIKAAKMRWGVELDDFFDLTGLVADQFPDGEVKAETWRKFNAGLLLWCGVVREELVKEWEELDAEKKMIRARSPKPSETWGLEDIP